MAATNNSNAKGTAITLALVGVAGILVAGPLFERTPTLDFTTTGSIAVALNGSDAELQNRRPCVLFNSGRREGDC